MTAAFLLLRAGPQEVPPSVYDGLPIRILAVCLWGWAAFAKATPAWWSGHALYADLLYLSPPALGALWAHMPDAWFVLFARTTLVIEAAIAVGLLFGPTARLASGAAVAMCVAFLPLVPIFGVATAVLTLAAARCTAVPVPGTARSQPHPPQLHPLQSHPLQPVRIWHMLALGGFLAWQVLLPVRTYLFDDHYATGRGWPWTWRQMTMVRHGQLRVEVLDPAYGWQDATPALTPIVDDFQAFPCSIPWGIAWVRRSRPDLLPPDRRVRVLRLGAGPAVPPACDTRTP